MEQSSFQSLPLYLILNDKLLAAAAVSRQEVKSKEKNPGEIAQSSKTYAQNTTSSLTRGSESLGTSISSKSICTYYIQPSFNVRYYPRNTPSWRDGVSTFLAPT